MRSIVRAGLPRWLVIGILAIGLVGCGRGCSANVPTPVTVPTADDEGKANEKLREMLQGKWENAADGQGLEFYSDGTVKLAAYRTLSATGKYQLLKGGILELDFPDNEEKEKVKVYQVNSSGLTLTGPSGKGEKATYKRVDQFSPELNHPNHKPNDLQKQWIIGNWQGIEKNPDDQTLQSHLLYCFRPDGTFLQVKQNNVQFLGKVEVGIGTYQVHPDADNFLKLTFPDTGQNKAIYAEIGEKELGLQSQWGFGKSIRKLQRVNDLPAFAQPPAMDVVPALALYQECKADPEAARKKYKDKQLKISGFLLEYTFSSPDLGDRYDLYLCTGEAARVKCSLDKKEEEGLKKLKKFLKPLSTIRVLVTVQGQFTDMIKEKSLGEGQSALFGGQPKHPGPHLMAHLSQCQVLEVVEVDLIKKMPAPKE